jgi:AmmeMemoRadiSam system protein B
MKTRAITAVLALILAWSAPAPAPATDAEVRALLEAVGIKPTKTMRGQMDIVGFATSASQMDRVVSQCDSLARSSPTLFGDRTNPGPDSVISAGLCPHDDYYYAGRLYSLLLPKVRARTVVIFGVFHKAKAFDCRDKLVFDSFEEWRGPYGPVKVSALREEILAELPKSDYVVDNEMQTVEHSVEAIVPFLQAYNRDVEIVSILVPYMDWNTLDRLASNLSGAIVSICRRSGWTLGRDVCLLSSCDAVHYGDSGWGGRNYAQFGTDASGYGKAVDRDVELAHTLLSGPVGSEKLREFLYACVDQGNVLDYKITWCGRFSVPFGLSVASRVAERLESRKLEGRLLDYGTSVSEASLELGALEGLGATAPNNLHHWVGYAAIAYR